MRIPRRRVAVLRFENKADNATMVDNERTISTTAKKPTEVRSASCIKGDGKKLSFFLKWAWGQRAVALRNCKVLSV